MLTRVTPDKLTAADVQLLVIADQANPKAVQLDAGETIRKIWAGDFELYRADGGIVLVQAVDGRLNVVRVAGEKLIFRFGLILKDLQHRARELGCSQIETMVYNRKIAKALLRIGAKAEAVNMVVELSDG